MKFSALLFLLLAASCTKKADSPSPAKLNPEELVQRGKAIYNLNCIACHNVDPSKDGAVGPALFGSTKELIEARILKATYPPGYKAKRASAQMPALPHLEKEIPALHAFLNSK